MSLARVYSRAAVGVTAPEVTVEVHVGGGLPRVSIVGLPQTAVRESKDRVKAALLNAGFEFPDGLVTISLAPADLPKEGSRFDLPIALGILAASGQVSDQRFKVFEFTGELSLGGGLNPVKGVLPAAIQAKAAGRGMVVPGDCGAEAALSGNPEAWCANSLLSVVSWLHGREPLKAARPASALQPPKAKTCRMSTVRHVHAERWRWRQREITTFFSPARPVPAKPCWRHACPASCRRMDEQEALDAAAVASVSQAGLDIERWATRSFRAPHHTASSAALVGGGSQPRPGEISLAHHGVLFLDELPEFNRNVLEVLREPMESGRIIISRAACFAEFPARFQLIAAMNPCHCGYHGDKSGRCRCTSDQVRRYRGKISGPLLDRIDLYVEVSRPSRAMVNGHGPEPEDSATVRERVIAARKIQIARAGIPNAQMSNAQVRDICRLTQPLEGFLESVAEKMCLSPRACQRILKFHAHLRTWMEAKQSRKNTWPKQSFTGYWIMAWYIDEKPASNGPFQARKLLFKSHVRALKKDIRKTGRRSFRASKACARQLRAPAATPLHPSWAPACHRAAGSWTSAPPKAA